MASSTAPASLRMVTESIERLAAPASQQIAYLTKLGTSPGAHELAIEFDDALRSRAGAAAPARMRERLHALDCKLDSMSGDRSKWQINALESDPDWSEVRKLAGLALHEGLASRS